MVSIQYWPSTTNNYGILEYLLIGTSLVPKSLILLNSSTGLVSTSQSETTSSKGAVITVPCHVK